jgi:hypothetical protein
MESNRFRWSVNKNKWKVQKIRVKCFRNSLFSHVLEIWKLIPKQIFLFILEWTQIFKSSSISSQIYDRDLGVNNKIFMQTIYSQEPLNYAKIRIQ